MKTFAHWWLIYRRVSVAAVMLSGIAAAAEQSGSALTTRPLLINETTAFPAPGASEICPDTVFRLTFPTAPSLGLAGKIQIVDATTNAVVDTIDASVDVASKNIGGFDGFNYHPVIISGRQVAIYPRNGVLAYSHSYFVKIDAGFFRASLDNYAGVNESATWRFTTRKFPPAVGAPKLIVSADGAGDFCTVQGALDFVPEGNVKPVTVFIRRGTYNEIVAFTNKHAVTLLGEERKSTVITYANNAKFNDGGGNPFGSATANPSTESPTGHVYRRGVLLGHRVNDLTIANLTVRNTTPPGGSQAETIILNGSTSARAILKDLDLFSYQDTLQVNGQSYITNCHIEGDVDFMWGTGPSFFTGVTAVMLRPNAYFTQVRNPATNHGFVFLGCTFDGTRDATNNHLSRVGTGRFPNSEVVLLDCQLGRCVSDIGWEFSGGREGDPKDPAKTHFWEFNSRSPAGELIDTTKRLPGSRRLVLPADSGLIGDYRDPAFVLGNHWDPKTAAIFR